MSDMDLFTFLVYLDSVVLFIQIFICFVLHTIELILILKLNLAGGSEEEGRER